jgi:tetratricopeptide (TPR) repeat protein
MWTAIAASLRTAVASAEESPAMPLSNEARAEKYFRSGEQKFDSGDYAGACEDFSESLKLGPKLGTLLNLALCHETTGKLVTAWHEFTHAAAWAAQNNQRDRHEYATQHIRALEPRLPRIVLQLPATRPIESIDLDGEPVPEHRWYLPLYLDPGEHHLAVSAPGKRRTTVAFRVVSSPTDQLVMVPPLADDIRALNPTTTVDPTRRTLGLTGLGLGALAFIAGTTFGVLALGADSHDTLKDAATLSTASFVTSAAFAVVGGWLLWTSTAAGASP